MLGSWRHVNQAGQQVGGRAVMCIAAPAGAQGWQGLAGDCVAWCTWREGTSNGISAVNGGRVQV